MKTAKSMVVAFCAMLMFTTFAAAQYGGYGGYERNPGYNRGPQRGGFRAPAPRALSNMIEARALLDNAPRKDREGTYVQAAVGNVIHGIEVLQEAMAQAGMDPNRLPPPDRIDPNAPSVERALRLIDQARRILETTNEPNGDLREAEDVAAREMQGAGVALRKHLDATRR